jgi:hypothetical protein
MCFDASNLTTSRRTTDGKIVPAQQWDYNDLIAVFE